MFNEKILRGVVLFSIVFSIINYYLVFFLFLLPFSAPGSETYLIGLNYIILVNFVYVLAIYLEFKAYKTGKIIYLILPVIISFFTIIPPILATIIKLILLIIIAVLIKKTSKENNKIARNNKEELWMIFGLNLVITIINYFIIIYFADSYLKNNQHIFSAMSLVFIFSVYLEFKAYKTKKIIYLILPFVYITYFFISIVVMLVKIILLICMAIAIKNNSKEHNKILENKQE